MKNEYKKARREYLEENPYCQRCGKMATDIHHKKGRMGELLIDKTFFMSACRPCHIFIEEHPAISYEKGWSIKRVI